MKRRMDTNKEMKVIQSHPTVPDERNPQIPFETTKNLGRQKAIFTLESEPVAISVWDKGISGTTGSGTAGCDCTMEYLGR